MSTWEKHQVRLENRNKSSPEQRSHGPWSKITCLQIGQIQTLLQKIPNSGKGTDFRLLSSDLIQIQMTLAKVKPYKLTYNPVISPYLDSVKDHLKIFALIFLNMLVMINC